MDSIIHGGRGDLLGGMRRIPKDVTNAMARRRALNDDLHREKEAIEDLEESF